MAEAQRQRSGVGGGDDNSNTHHQGGGGVEKLALPLPVAAFVDPLIPAMSTSTLTASWPGSDHGQIGLIHSPTPLKCSTRALMALINNLGIVYHQYCFSPYLDLSFSSRIPDTGPLYPSRQWKSSSNLIPTKPPEPQSQSRLPTDSPESPKAPSTLSSPLPTPPP